MWVSQILWIRDESHVSSHPIVCRFRETVTRKHNKDNGTSKEEEDNRPKPHLLFLFSLFETFNRYIYPKITIINNQRGMFLWHYSTNSFFFCFTLMHKHSNWLSNNWAQLHTIFINIRLFRIISCILFPDTLSNDNTKKQQHRSCVLSSSSSGSTAWFILHISWCASNTGIIWTLASYICILSRIIIFTLGLNQYIHKSTIYISLAFNLWYVIVHYIYNHDRRHSWGRRMMKFTNGLMVCSLPMYIYSANFAQVQGILSWMFGKWWGSPSVWCVFKRTRDCNTSPTDDHRQTMSTT